MEKLLYQLYSSFEKRLVAAIVNAVMRTMVNLFVDIEIAPPLIDTFIAPEVPGELYALFDYGLTLLR